VLGFHPFSREVVVSIEARRRFVRRRRRTALRPTGIR
jgi:hypothetical protein